MRIITTTAARDLLMFLETIKGRAVGYRAVLFGMASYIPEGGRQSTARMLQKIFEDAFVEEPDVKLYVMENDDLFLVGRGITKQRLDRIEKEMVSLFSAEDETLRFVVDDFDLSVRYDAFQRLIAARQTPRTTAAAAAVDIVKEIEDILRQVKPEYLAPKKAKRKTRSPMSILLVEDEAFSRSLTANALGQDYKIVTAANGKEAIEQYLIELPNLVFLDINLPDIGGHQILAFLLQLDPEAFVVMLSSHSSMDHIQKAIQEGAKGFVAKPFTKVKLVHYIDEAKKYYQG